MKKLFFLLVFVLIRLSAICQGTFETYSELSFNNAKYNAFVVKLDVTEISKFNVIQNNNVLQHQDFLNDLLSKDSMIFLINACISDTLCRPIGYYVENSQQIQTANLGSGSGNFFLKPNGALLFMQDNVIICATSEIQSYKNVKLGVQSGPLLLSNGAVNPQFNPISQNKNIRCGVGIYSDSKGDKFLVFAISNNPISFFDFAELFSKKFKCDSALCLESVGCAMYFHNLVQLNEKFNGYICNYIYFKL